MRLILIIVAGGIVGALFGFVVGRNLATKAEWSIEMETPAKVSGTPAPVPKDHLVVASPESPKISISEKIFDFGILEGDQGGKHDFIIKNDGKKTLTLKLGHKSCSCTNVSFSTTHLSAGQSGKITLTWDNRQSIRGSFRHGASIMTNDPETPEFVLNIIGVYSAPIIVTPQPVLMQGIMTGKEASHTFRLYGFEPTPLEIEGADWDDQEHFDITFTKSALTDKEKDDRVFKGAKAVYDGKVTVKPGLPFGHFRQLFKLRSNSIADPNFNIALEGQMIGNLQLISADYNREKGILEMGRTPRGVTLEKVVMIQFPAPGGDKIPKFSISSVKPEWIKASVGEVKGGGVSQIVPVTIEIPKEANLGTYLGPEPDQYGEVMIKSDLPNIGEIRIPVSFVVEGGI